MINITESENAVTFSVRVIPRSSKTEIIGELDGSLKVKLKSPPVDGAANEELVRFLSKVLCTSRSNIEILSGASSRTKLIRIGRAAGSNIASILRAKI